MGQLIKTYTSFEASVEIAGGIAAAATIAQIQPRQQEQLLRPVTMGIQAIMVQALDGTAAKIGLIEPLTAGTSDPAFTTEALRVSQGNGGCIASGSQGRIISGWSVEPTYDTPPFYFRSAELPAVQDSSFEWNWPEDDPFTRIEFTSGAFSGPLARGPAGIFGVGMCLQNIGADALGPLLVTVRFIQFNPASL